MRVVQLRNDDAPSLIGVAAAALHVTLEGPAGNPTGVGAKLTWRGPGGRVRVREVVAGDGYLTQSTAAASFPGRDGVVEVRWPDGHVTTHELTGEASSVTLRP